MSIQAAYYEGNQTFRVGDGQVVPPGPGEVRIAVNYCGICGTDVHIYHGKMDRRVHIPQVIGHEAAGAVAEVGPGVDRVRPGDRVVVRPLQPGEPAAVDAGYRHIGQNLKFIGIDTPGAFQGSWTVPAHTLHLLPETVSDLHAALIEPLAVACHDVRLANLQPGENAVVIGGGPIGLLIGLVAQRKGGRVMISEVNAQRRTLAEELGLATVNPLEDDLVEAVARFTDQAFADVVFEVSGTQAGVEAMTQLPRVRGRIVMVAIHAQPQPVDLFRFFWRELQLIGVRVYEPEDFDEAIALAAEGQLPLERLITEVAPLAQVQELFQRIDRNPEGMKYLLKCS
ncbi:MAG: alcohol dehydrogenase catalytic domain-containing protein [Thermoguttaceae bacterium]|jgi:2-desacetyl-2-hydroxyethyl bacteriochlorophyllide A dehydrogenase|nr:alcohol dehydrogenase catalytic domain-containing protein [Thermoguttaceae bacterium]